MPGIAPPRRSGPNPGRRRLVPLVALAAVLCAATIVDLVYLEVHRESGLSGAFGVAVSPDGKHVYAVGYDDDALLAYARQSATGTLSLVDTERDGVSGVDGLAGADAVTVSPDGAHVYATGFVDNAVAVFSRNSTTGALTFVERQKDQVGGNDGLGGPEWVAVSPDGKHVYVAASEESKIGVFSRNASTGKLNFASAVANVDGLLSVSAVAVSPDSKHVYATGFDDDAVVVFSRNSTTGALTWVETIRNDAVVDGLLGALGVAVSADGKNVYVAGNADNALVTFSRNATTGHLTFVEVKKDGLGGVNGLFGADSVTVSADGVNVYATGCFADALAFFSRDLTTGALQYRGVRQDGKGGVDGLFGAVAVAVSPDGNNVYVAGQLDGALAVFRGVRAQCGDGIDNDGDGKIDLADPGCKDSDWPVENPGCNDGLDNDHDGKIDFDGGLSVLGPGNPNLTEPDPYCVDRPFSRTEAFPVCGLGAELGVVLPALAWLRRRARGRARRAG
jgi:6-phosphogluconolactonase (cycloisomerase 2 family)